MLCVWSCREQGDAREMGWHFRHFLSCSWRGWLCFLAAEEVLCCLFVGEHGRVGVSCLHLPVLVVEGEAELLWGGRRWGSKAWSCCVQGRLSLLCRAPACWAGLGLLGGSGEASPWAQQETAAGESAGQVVLLGWLPQTSPRAQNRLETTCGHSLSSETTCGHPLSSDRPLLFCLWTRELYIFLSRCPPLT